MLGEIVRQAFDEEAKIGKLRELIPANVWCYIAQSARGAKTYRELVALIMNQLTDPKTGMLQGEKQPRDQAARHRPLARTHMQRTRQPASAGRGVAMHDR